jgi:hypothetical protein
MNAEPTQSTDLQALIDWEKIMPMSRCAGGHDEQMQGLFQGATVLGHWNEGDCDGQVATAVKLPDGRVWAQVFAAAIFQKLTLQSSFAVVTSTT